MQKLSIALVALALALALVPAAMATQLCSSDASAITISTVCYEGGDTDTFANISIVGFYAAGTNLFFNPSQTYVSGHSVNLGFQVVLPSGDTYYYQDIDLEYEVQGPPGYYQLYNSFNGPGVISEQACTYYPSCYDELTTFLNTTGAETSSPFFSSTGTFYIDKDVEDFGFTDFTDGLYYTDADPVPEFSSPSSLVPLGTWLLGVGFLLYRCNRTARSGSII
jgi:hypothetical protein